eukprot:Skav212438  [mRNA]  locus=scaffold5136:2595:2888:- [translate_table: standard]
MCKSNAGKDKKPASAPRAASAAVFVAKRKALEGAGVPSGKTPKIHRGDADLAQTDRLLPSLPHNLQKAQMAAVILLKADHSAARLQGESRCSASLGL